MTFPCGLPLAVLTPIRSGVRIPNSHKHEKTSPDGLVFSWLERRFLNITFYGGEIENDVDDIKPLLEDSKDADEEVES